LGWRTGFGSIVASNRIEITPNCVREHSERENRNGQRQISFYKPWGKKKGKENLEEGDPPVAKNQKAAGGKRPLKAERNCMGRDNIEERME